MVAVFKNTPRLSWFRFRVRTLLILIAVVAALIGGARLYQSLTADVEANAWVGWSQGELVRRLGQPKESYESDVNPINEPRPVKPPAVPRRTLYFETRWGHLWIWLRPEDGRWVCYHSIWYSDGTRF